MNREVRIVISAPKKLIAIFDYLDEKWSKEVRIKFAEKLYNTVEIIRSNPEIFPNSPTNKSVYKCVITKQVSIFYAFNEKQITIISIFDTRQNPAKIEKEIKDKP